MRCCSKATSLFHTYVKLLDNLPIILASIQFGHSLWTWWKGSVHQQIERFRKCNKKQQSRISSVKHWMMLAFSIWFLPDGTRPCGSVLSLELLIHSKCTASSCGLLLRREVDEGDTGRCRGHLLGLPRIGSIDLDSSTKCQDLIGQFSSRRKVMANSGGRDP